MNESPPWFEDKLVDGQVVALAPRVYTVQSGGA